MLLYIIFYTLYYFFGLSHISIYEFLIICVKVGIIAQLLRDNSWNFFYNNAFSLFVNAPNQLIGIANFRGTDSNVFEFLDLPLNRFLSRDSLVLMISLIFSGPLGIVAFCLLLFGFLMVVYAIFNALFSFVTSIAIIALLLSLAPVFIICVLFTYTRQMFYRWVAYLARFTMHPVILLIFISLISQMMDYVLYSIFNFEVCSKCVFGFNIPIPIPTVLLPGKLFIPENDSLVWTYDLVTPVSGSSLGIVSSVIAPMTYLYHVCIFFGFATKSTPNIASIMVFIILAHAMKAMVNASSVISDSLFSSYIPNEPGKKYQQNLLGIVGLDEESVQKRGGGTSSAPQNPRPQIPQQTQVPRK